MFHISPQKQKDKKKNNCCTSYIKISWNSVLNWQYKIQALLQEKFYHTDEA